MSRVFTATISFLIFLLLVACGNRIQPGTEKTPVPIVESPVSTTFAAMKDWVDYTDPDLEFSFSYPPTANMTTGKNPLDLSKNIDIQFESPDKPYQGMSIRLQRNPQRLQGPEIVRRLYEESTQTQAPAEFMNSFHSILVGKAAAIEASIPSLNTETTVILAFEDKVFILSPVHASAVTQVEKETLDLFYQILTTFKFEISQ